MWFAPAHSEIYWLLGLCITWFELWILCPSAVDNGIVTLKASRRNCLSRQLNTCLIVLSA
jgi:hypothetical protein